jgi:hypothetical protein
MSDIIARVIANLVGRLTGPLTFRLVLQPTMATIAAIKAGIDDARHDKPAYLWVLASNPSRRHELLKDGWKDVTTVFAFAVVIDVIYQWIALRWVYPGEAVLVAFLLACVPYVLIRGPVNRLARIWMRRGRGGRS